MLGRHSSSQRSIKRSVVACIYNTRPLTKFVFDRLFKQTSYIRLYSKLSQRSACIYSTRPLTKPISCLIFFLFLKAFLFYSDLTLCRWFPEAVYIPCAKLDASDKSVKAVALWVVRCRMVTMHHPSLTSLAYPFPGVGIS